MLNKNLKVINELLYTFMCVMVILGGSTMSVFHYINDGWYLSPEMIFISLGVWLLRYCLRDLARAWEYRK